MTKGRHLPALLSGARNLGGPGSGAHFTLSKVARVGPRQLADAVVTEHGVAELRERSLPERAQALIAISAPEHRDALAAAWEDILRTA